MHRHAGECSGQREASVHFYIISLNRNSEDLKEMRIVLILAAKGQNRTVFFDDETAFALRL